uniref:SGNH hydrolase-type esterase domain-containing protein n=1 Tax=Leersia perrieri TaxID=77586 RepID=A0A0D9XGY4_9ORYZ
MAMVVLLLCSSCLVVEVAAAAAPDDSTAAAGNGGCPSGKGERPLWVFGDSYADTGNLGNLGRDLTHAWYYPYGLTFPRRPTGRFSDGRVLTDFLASAVGIPTPVAYKLRRRGGGGLLSRGMNFAVGGSGVLDTGYFQRNISSQIDLFQKTLRGCAPTAGVAAVVVSGNDYSAVVDKNNGTSEAAIAYIPTVMRGLREQLRRLRDDVGMGKVIVTNLHPMGCTPYFTRTLNYSGCDTVANAGADQHNAALRSVLHDLDPTNRTFLLLDLHTPFLNDNSERFPVRLRPCCETFKADGYCGQEDEGGKKLYTVCDDPERHFYWDDVHPTQAAWAAVADAFTPAIHDFLST